MSKVNQPYRNVHHIPVLLEPVLDCLSPAKGESYLDLTAGMGGHAASILDATKAPDKAILVDRDESATLILKSRFPKTSVHRQDYLSASQELVRAGAQFDLILADLGVSSLHFDDASRGFSINHEGPLDMRMDRSIDLTAEAIVNNWSQSRLVGLIKVFGEEPRARQIARAIVEARPISSTSQLAAIISGVWHNRRRRIHPATKTFQALRIAVNDELGQLEKSLPIWIKLLAPGGRIAVISFHSLEDRLVKKALAEYSGNRYDAELALITKRPIPASPAEIAINPRARSARLRVAAKIKNRKDKV